MKIWSAVVALSVLAASGSVAQPKDANRIVDPRDVVALEEGVWDAVITAWPGTAGGTPVTTTGIQVNERRSAGLWMLNRLSVNGGKYEGTGIWGYNPRTGNFSGIWVDNSSGRIRMDEGRWDPNSNTMTWSADIERPDGQKVRMWATSTFVGSTRTYRSFAMSDGSEVPLSTVVFTRRPSATDR